MNDGIPVLRTSERGTFNDCEAKHNWAWGEGLIPRSQKLDARWFGTGVHLGLALWYCGPGKKRGPHPAETWLKYSKDEIGFAKTKDATENEVAQYTDMAELGRIMLEGYVKLYGKDEHMHVVEPEHTFALDIPWSNRQQVYDFEPGAILVRYLGTYDLVYLDLRDSRYKLEEHKTAKTISFGHLPMDNQGGSYWAIASMVLRERGLLKPNQTLACIEYNFLRKAIPDDRPRDAQGYYTNKPAKADYVKAIEEAIHEQPWNGPRNFKGTKHTVSELVDIGNKLELTVVGERSKTQPPPLFARHPVYRTRAERATQLRRIQDEAVHIQAVRDGLLPVTKSPSRMSCGWCDFKEMCELQERGGNWEDYKKLMFTKRDPYADHRKSTDEP